MQDPTIINGKYGVFLFEKAIQTNAKVRKALESQSLKDFFQGYYNTKPATYAYKWLRAVAEDEFTGAHFDSVYMGRGSQDLLTAWIPLGDIPVE